MYSGSEEKTKMKMSWQKVQTTFIEYSERSSIHGFPYIVERNRSWFERILWILVIFMASICCGKLIFDAWNIHPIIISFTEKPTSIWEIPFPAISICTQLFTPTSKINLTSIIRRIQGGVLHPDHLSAEEKMVLLATDAFCHQTLFFGELGKTTNCNDCVSTIREIRVPPEEMFVECKYQNQVVDCMDIFKEIVIDYGICHTFNGFGIYRSDTENIPKEWSLDGGYELNAPVGAYPRRALGAGTKFGLSVLLRIKKIDIDFTCANTAGFWIDHHMPHESPDIAVTDIQIGDSAIFVLKPKIMVHSKKLNKYPISVRKCYFDNERPLKYFSHYTRRNCELECEVKMIRQQCGCFRLSIDSFSALERGADICGPLQFNCTYDARSNLLSQNYGHCGCLPTCSSLTFSAELTSVNELARLAQDGFAYTHLEFYLKESEVMTSQRSELHDNTDFLANCGGLMGLCLGISVMSLFEIGYFCIIRVYLNFRRGEASNHVEVPSTNDTRTVRLVDTLRDLIRDYSQKTTIQGIKYVGDRSLSIGERLWWVVVVVVSVLCFGLLIFDVIKRYDDSPVIITFENQDTAIDEVPFPAVTICSQFVTHIIGQMYQDLIVDRIPFYAFDEGAIDTVTTVAQVCDPELFGHLDPDNKTNCDNCSDILLQMMGAVADVLEYCVHLVPMPCSQMFKRVVTEDGVCYTYNGLDIYRNDETTEDDDSVHWTLEDGFKKRVDLLYMNPQPGSLYALTVVLSMYKSFEDGLCKGLINGFRLYLHLPNEVPPISKHYYLVPYQIITKINVSPNLIKIEPELRNLPPDKRQCYFSDERYLRFFKYYTQGNCEVECVANLTLEICGCLRFNMPKIPGVKYCGIGEIKCYQTIVDKYQNTNQAFGCDCLTTCTSITYDADINQANLVFESDQSQERKEYINQFSISEFTVAMRTNQFVALRRSRLYGITELFANCGALLGLFLGFSMVSLLEFVYFFTFRLCHELKSSLLNKH